MNAMTEEQRRRFATSIMKEAAREVDYVDIFEIAEGSIHTDGEISEADAGAVADLIGDAEVEITWPAI